MTYYGGMSKHNIPIDQYLDEKFFQKKENGFFIELGAHNGEFFSNTLFLEETRRWKGILIEPSQQFFACEKRRSNPSFQCACIDKEEIKSMKGLFIGSPMDALNIASVRKEKKGNHVVETRTLCSILQEYEEKYGTIEKIDFLSLDVEGSELLVLKGLGNYRPEYILIEVYGKYVREINAWLYHQGYGYVELMTDFHKKEKYPAWDGNHQDFLWKYEPENIERRQGITHVFRK